MLRAGLAAAMRRKRVRSLTTGLRPTYIDGMKSLYLLTPLFALLVATFWFAGETWTRMGDVVPPWGWFAIGGGVLFSLAIGGGLMALMFYSARHGYDDAADGSSSVREKDQ